MERVAKSYRLKKETVEKLEKIQFTLEQELGTNISATATIEILINKYHNEHIKK